MNNTLLIGADPELFIKKNNKIISAEGYIEGNKENPFEFAKGFGIQLDNVACEFNIPPSSTFKEFNNNIIFALNFIRDKLKRNNLKICSNTCTHNFDKKFIETKNAKEFGCDPDYDVYLEKPNNSPDVEKFKNFRTVAGHIHIGYSNIAEVTIEKSENIVKAFDLFVTVPSILTDSDKERRKLYGKAGAFRMKNYGVEVRMLSNFWIFNEKLRKMVYEATIIATNLALYRNLDKVLSDNEEKIKKAINSYDEDIASELIRNVIAPFYREQEEINSLKKIKKYV